MQPILRFATQTIRSSAQDLLGRASQDTIQRPTTNQDQEYLNRVEARFFRSFSRAVARSYPDHNVVDVSNFSTVDGVTWVIEAINGRTNFLRRSEQFCTLLGIYVEHKLRYGLIVDHFRDGEYRVEHSQGSFGGNGRLRVSDLRSTDGSIVAINDSNLAKRVHQATSNERVTGSTGLDVVNTAAGKFDALMLSSASIFEFQLYRLFIRESGGFATTLGGGEWLQPTDGFVGGNTFMHRKLLASASRPLSPINVG